MLVLLLPAWEVSLLMTAARKVLRFEILSENGRVGSEEDSEPREVLHFEN